jgi:magnesium transporter
VERQAEKVTAMGNVDSWETLAGLIGRGRPEEIQGFIEGLSPVDTALAISRLDDDVRTRLFEALTPDEAADVLHDLPQEQAAGVLTEIPPSAAAAIVDRWPADEQADILGDIRPSDAEAILDEMPDATAEHTRTLLRYPPDRAGGLMTSEFVAYPSTAIVRDVIDDLARNSDRYAEYQVQYLYITDSAGRLVGVLRMRDLLVVSRTTGIAQLMVTNPLHVTVDTGLAELTRVFEDHSFLGIPVVDSQGRLEGLVERQAVENVRRKQVGRSFLRISGIVGGEEFRSAGLRTRILRRLAWLGPNIALNMLAASIIALYQDTLQAAIALAVFLPIISDMSGCSGNQAIAVSIRELSMGLLKAREFGRVIAKESWVGLVNGMILGILLGGVAFLWKGNVYLSIVVASALAANTLFSVLVGGSVPLLLKRMRIDPALASGPILTTVTDMCGFFLVLSIAQSVVEKL